MKNPLQLLGLIILSLAWTGCSDHDMVEATLPLDTEATIPVRWHYADTLRILAIGSSHTCDAVDHYLDSLLREDGIPFKIVRMHESGCALSAHLYNLRFDEPTYTFFTLTNHGRSFRRGVTLREGLTADRWNYITINQCAEFSGVYSTYQASLPLLMAEFNRLAPQAEIVLHMTWAVSKFNTAEPYRKYGYDQLNMYSCTLSAYYNAMRDYDINYLIPTGTAIQNARTTHLDGEPGQDLLMRDDRHLNTVIGSYIASATWYETITGRKAADNAFRPAGISDADWRLADECVHAAVIKPFAITDLHLLY